MEGNDHGEAYTAIVWGGLLSRVSSNIVEAETFTVVEGDMCGAVMRGAVALPRSKTPPRTKGSRRNLGDPTPDQRRRTALVRIGNEASAYAGNAHLFRLIPASATCEKANGLRTAMRWARNRPHDLVE